MNIRSILYFLAQILGDANAISKNSVVKRIARRSIGRYSGKHMMRRLVGRR